MSKRRSTHPSQTKYVRLSVDDAVGMLDRIDLLLSEFYRILRSSSLERVCESNVREGHLAFIVTCDTPIRVPNGRIEVEIKDVAKRGPKLAIIGGGS